MREEFEAWATESTDLWLMPVMFDGVFVNYYDENAADAFNVWKASRAALCVELPDESATFWHQDVCEALDVAGVTYK